MFTQGEDSYNLNRKYTNALKLVSTALAHQYAWLNMKVQPRRNIDNPTQTTSQCTFVKMRAKVTYLQGCDVMALAWGYGFGKGKPPERDRERREKLYGEGSDSDKLGDDAQTTLKTSYNGINWCSKSSPDHIKDSLGYVVVIVISITYAPGFSTDCHTVYHLSSVGGKSNKTIFCVLKRFLQRAIFSLYKCSTSSWYGRRSRQVT